MKLYSFCTIFLLTTFSASAYDFEGNWWKAQQLFLEWDNFFSSPRFDNAKRGMLIPHWEQRRLQTRSFLLREHPGYFWLEDHIACDTIRGGYGSPQQFEECFLNNCISESTKHLLKRFKDVDESILYHESKLFNCSTNSLGHLYYTAKILDFIKQKPETIIDFGGGYGNLVRIFKQILPESTLIIIDFPEMLAISYHFLTSTLNNPQIRTYKSLPTAFEKGCIHLLPVYLIKDAQLDCDVFVSTFALSESSKKTQDIVIGKKFFNARTCYISGQIDGWNQIGQNWEHQSSIMNGIRTIFSHVSCSPFQIFAHNEQSFEIIGTLIS